MYASIILVFLYVSFCIDYIKYRSNGFPKPVTGYGSGQIQYIFRRLFFCCLLSNRLSQEKLPVQ